ncbi:hypothetical protein F4861DRAFT_530736 [Xylaria intraflava]|nr:hypothetical protein F4861DRAFT_530736 [Xylaria intraflava]
MDSKQSSSPSAPGRARRAPLSSFSTYRQQAFQPSCTHLTMTRMYDMSFNCSLCHAIEKNQSVSFDALGTVLSDGISPGARSPEKRSHQLSFFEEITSEQLKTYSPTQIATILKQRENLLDVLSQQHRASGKVQQPSYIPSGSYRGRLLRPPPGFGYSVTTRPWVPHKNEECQAKYCHNCRPSCEPRSYLSLNAVLNGDVSPTAATGFGFHRMRARPVADVEVMRHIGLRPVPMPHARSRTYQSSPSSQSISSLAVAINGQIIEPNCLDSETLPELGDVSTTDSVTSTHSRASAFEGPRPAWSPPSTPTSWTGIARREDGMITFRNTPFVCDGRSPNSLTTNDQVRQQIIESIAGLMSQEVDEEEIEKFQSICSFESRDQSRLLRASLDSIMPPIFGTGHDYQESIAPMTTEELELREGCFHQEPLDVVDGIAVMEESIELGVPDVITQV